MPTQTITSLLDNPIHNALIEVDSQFNLGNESCAFFDKEMAPFIGLKNWSATEQKHILKYAPDDRFWFLLISAEIDFIEEFDLLFTVPVLQFVCHQLEAKPKSKVSAEIVPLNDSHVPEMLALTALTKPGPFTSKTINFGNYHGIFINGRLAAMGGERFHVGEFCELSAICTHPDFQGLGLAGQITHFLAESVFSKGKTPFLHARIDNVRAIEVYKRLGFELRKEITFYLFSRKENVLENESFSDYH